VTGVGGDRRCYDASVSPCPDEHALSSYVERVRAGHPEREVDEHLADCTDCRQLVFAIACATLSPGAPAPGPAVSRKSLGRYRLDEIIGAGGMGLVFAAFDPALRRQVAIKVLRRAPTGAGAAHLLAEARALARLSHANVVTVHDVGEEAGEVFLAMERLDARDLHAWSGERRRSWREVVDVLSSAGEGLAAAHRVDLVHRDVKPQNVLISRDGRVCLADFGLAAGSGAMGESDDPGGAPGIGTLGYMAPEQLDGGRADARSDIFSYCATLHEALYDRRPFAGHGAAELAAAMRRPLEIPRHRPVPGRIVALLRRGLAIDPARRPASMDEILQVLRGPLRRRRIQVAALAGVVALAGGSAWAILHRPDEACADARDRVASVWSPADRARIEKALAPSGATETEGVLYRLENQARRWIAIHDDTCEATHVRRTQSGELHDRRMTCLARRLRSLDVAVRALAGATSGSASSAIAVAEQMPSLDWCGEPVALQVAAPLPADPSDRGQLREVVREIARADALAGRAPAEALAVATRAVELADRLAHPPLQADALDALGAIQHQLHRLDAARDSQARATVAATAGRRIEVLSTGQELPGDLEVDGDDLYWVNATNAGLDPGVVRSVGKRGGSPTDVERGIQDVGEIELDAERIYWSAGAAVAGVGGIRSRPKAGGPIIDVVRDMRVFQLDLLGDDIVFASPDRGGRILRVPKAGGPITTLAEALGSGLDNTPLLAIAGGYIFFTQATLKVACDGRVRAVPQGGGPVTTIADGVCHLIGLEADERAVYWTEFDEGKRRGRLLARSAPFTGAATVLAEFPDQPLFLALDDDNVYCTSGRGKDPKGRIHRIPKAGGPARVLATDQLLPSSLALDATHVYWTTALDGEVKRIAR
jgi:hypothetical protein